MDLILHLELEIHLLLEIGHLLIGKRSFLAHLLQQRLSHLLTNLHVDRCFTEDVVENREVGVFLVIDCLRVLELVVAAGVRVIRLGVL